jgi:long-chain acyl-CoA synthetase
VTDTWRDEASPQMVYASNVQRNSIADYLRDFERLGSAPAFAERSGYRTVRWSYRQFAETAYRFARELNTRRIRKGERVMLWGPNSVAWAAAFFACANRGVIAVPMDDAASADFALRVFRQVDARLLVCSRDHLQAGLECIFLEDLRERVNPHSQAALAPESVSPNDPLEIVFTSGTTAEPKGVVITHGNVLSNVAPLEQQIKSYLKYEALVHPIRFLNLLPLSHVFGQFLGIYLPPLLSGMVFFQDSLNPSHVINTIRRERISVLVAVPKMMQSLKEKIERDLEGEGKLEGFRAACAEAEGKHFVRRWWIFRRIHRQFGLKFWAFISGGAALDPETEEFWRKLGFAVIQGYGLTETTSLISVNHPFKTGKGSIGKVLAGRDVNLAPDGEILVRGSGVASGYWSGGQLRPVTSEEGWYHTGDIGELDAEGNLYFKGRKKETIVTPAGMKVYPEDLEVALKKRSEVRDAVVVPLAIGGNAEACAALILQDGVDATSVIEHANAGLADFQRIRQWIVWPDDDFPRTSTQKPRRAEIAQAVQTMISNSRGAPLKLGLGGRSGLSAGAGLQEIVAQITKRSAANQADDAHLDADLNLRSLERVELMSALEDRYQTDLSESKFSAVKTVGDLSRLLKSGPAERAVYHYPAWAQGWPVTWLRFAIHYLLLRPAVFVLGWPRIVGREHLRRLRGPVLVISNHVDDVDVGFIQTALPFRFRHKLATAVGGEALEALRTPPKSRHVLLRWFDRMEWFFGVSLLNLFPLPREAGFRDSFAFAGESADRGYSILVFPEGHHTTDGRLRPFRSGVGLLANNLRIPVVPMRIDGLFEVKQKGKKMAKPGRITVKIGDPVEFHAGRDPAEIARELRQKIESL